MTNKNPFNNDELDIPDFVEDTNDDSVDKSIFEMSEEELYDTPKKEKKATKTSSKKSNSTIILCLAIIVVLIVTSVVTVIYALSEHKNATTLTNQYAQIKVKNDELQDALQKKDSEIAKLKEEIENIKNSGTTTDPTKKYASGTVLYITEEGSNQGVRVKANVDAETAVDSDGYNIVLYWGDEVKLIADATKDSDGNYWGQISSGFIRIEYEGEIWATTEEQ